MATYTAEFEAEDRRYTYANCHRRIEALCNRAEIGGFGVIGPLVIAERRDHVPSKQPTNVGEVVNGEFREKPAETERRYRAPLDERRGPSTETCRESSRARRRGRGSAGIGGVADTVGV